MKAEMTRRSVCLTCRNEVLEDEFVGSHKVLKHDVQEFVFGKYVKPDALKEVPKLKEERMKQASGEYAEELNSYEEEY